MSASDRRQRIPIGLTLFVAILSVAFIDHGRDEPVVAPYLVALLGIVAFWEFKTLAKPHIPTLVRRLAVVLAAILLVVPHLTGISSDPASFLAVMAYSMPLTLGLLGAAWILARRTRPVETEDLTGLGVAVVGFGAVALPMAFLGGIFYLPDGILFGLMIVVSSKLNDIGGYLVGSTLGRRKLAPGVSPGKTVEGSLAGLALGTAGAVALTLGITELCGRITWYEALFVGVLIGIVTQIGDLFESALKRATGIKDSARLIPAFGGILDLVDSLIFAAPLGYALGHFLLARDTSFVP